MSASAFVTPGDWTARAQLSRGTSNDAIYRMVAQALDGRHPGGGVLLDVGCGTGNLWAYVGNRFDAYIGIDAVRYEGFPASGIFHGADLDALPVPVAGARADVVAAVETIEHLENPRAFLRELVRLAKPGGWVLVTTPNQLSLLSKLTLVVKNQFNAFQEVHYPAHLTALLEVDLRRLAAECGLTSTAVAYSLEGRLVLTPWHYPGPLARLFPRALSDNVLLIGQRSDH
jgi:2-polyprenyl-3-methyl-5-hydroxy-6-metoxy-1,4-benzoquinol methylase